MKSDIEELLSKIKPLTKYDHEVTWEYKFFNYRTYWCCLSKNTWEFSFPTVLPYCWRNFYVGIGKKHAFYGVNYHVLFRRDDISSLPWEMNYSAPGKNFPKKNDWFQDKWVVGFSTGYDRIKQPTEIEFFDSLRYFINILDENRLCTMKRTM